MPTVAEILKSTGMTDEQIAALDAKAVAGFTSVMTAAETERQEGELARRAATQMFENEITPALNAWGVKEANVTAERDYYKTLAEKAKTGGFIAEAPPFQPRNEGGQFVPNANPVPGSPNFQEFENRAAGAIGALTDMQWRYQNLFGKGMPDSPTSLVAEATAQRMPLIEYVAKKYDFAGRETAIRAEESKKREDAIRLEERALVTKEYAERGGSNPNVRQGQVSQYAEMKKGVAEGKRVDPLTMTREQRHAATAAAIRQDIATKTVQ